MSLEKKHVEVKTARLYLRPMRVDDAADFYLMRSDPEAMKWTSSHPDTEVSQTADQIRKWIQDGRYNFCMELLSPSEVETGQLDPSINRKVIGAVGIVRYEQPYFPEIGYCMNQNHWGKGYATEALRAFLEIGWEHLSQPGGSDVMFARVDMANIGSIRVLEKVGFHVTETIEREFDNPVMGWRDTHVMRLERPKPA